MNIFFMFLKPAGYSHKRKPHIPIKGLRLGHLLGTGKPKHWLARKLASIR